MQNDTYCFVSRKTTTMNKFVLRAIFDRLLRCGLVQTNNSAIVDVAVTRININTHIYTWTLLPTRPGTDRYNDVENRTREEETRDFETLSLRNAKRTHISSANEIEDTNLSPTLPRSYDGTMMISQMISSFMKDVQQNNLNAKHSAFRTKYTNDESDDSKLYIGLNRSCAQRKIVEVCLAVETNESERFVFDAFGTKCRIVQLVPLARSGISLRVMYILTTRQQLVNFLERFERSFGTLPSLLFVSCKNFVYDSIRNVSRSTAKRKTVKRDRENVSDGNSNERRECANEDERLAIRSFVSNFLTYHLYHDCDKTLDARRLGINFDKHCFLTFVLALVNARLLTNRVNDASVSTHSNIALNTQSLGKGTNDAGYQIFAENSLYHLNKVQDDSTFRTHGHLVNRFLGKCSRVGINSVSFSIRLI